MVRRAVHSTCHVLSRSRQTNAHRGTNIPGMVANLDRTMAQRMLPTARLVAWAELLALPADALDAYVADQVARHAALDAPVGRTCPRCGGTVWRAGAHACLSRWPTADAAGVAAAVPYDAILADLSLSDTDRAVARHLLADADARGRIDRPLADIAAALDVTEDDVRRVLDAVRTVAPPGFGARDLRESLLLQLAARDDAPPLCRAVVDRLDELGDLDAGEREALDWIATHLAASSALPDDRPAAAGVRPDLTVDATLTVRLVDAPWLAVRVAPSYERLAAADPRVRAAAAQGRAVVGNLATRAHALVRIAQAAVDRQPGWVSGGAHVPLTRAEVAAYLGLHESTVSRAVAGKRMLLPDGRVVAVRDLFGQRGRSARDCLRDLLAREETPASDAALAVVLTALGHPSARRTVAKYRAELGVPSHRARTAVRDRPA